MGKKNYNNLNSVKKNKNKKKDFTLVNLPPWAQNNPHIGVGYLCSYLRKHNINFEVIDLNKNFYIEYPELKMLWHIGNKNFWSNEKTFPLIMKIFEEAIDKGVNKILNSNSSGIGFSVVDPKEKLCIEFIKKIKQKCPDKKIILGGPATSTSEQRKIFLDNIEDYINVFVIGEGEETLYELVKKILNKKNINEVKGCFIKRSGKWINTGEYYINNLERIPFPTYREFDLQLYGNSLLVEWSRGCTGRCSFCKNHRLFSHYRTKSLSWIIEELKYHKFHNNISEFTVVDNILNGDPYYLEEICMGIEKEKLDIRWTGQIAPSKEMNFDLFKKMKAAGCYRLQIGFESGSDNVLKLMKKPFTTTISELNIRAAKKAGIETEIFIIVGFPGEEEKDFIKTKEFIKRNHEFIDTIQSINTLHLIAGTEVFEEYRKYKIKTLPGKKWYYLWETENGESNYRVRKRRGAELLKEALSLEINVRETNLKEGKESLFEYFLKNRKDKDLETSKNELIKHINKLQNLKNLNKKTNIDFIERPFYGKNKRFKKSDRLFFKLGLLIFITTVTFLFSFYIWLLKKVRGIIVFPGT